MPDIKELMADPQFDALSVPQQKAVLGKIDPSFSALSDEQFGAFRDKAKTKLTPPPVSNSGHADSPEKPKTTPDANAPPGAARRFAGSFGEQFNPMPVLRAGGRVLGDVAQGKFKAAGAELDQDLLGGTREYGAKAVNARHTGHPLDWFMYSVGATPGLPPIAEGYDQVSEGDVAGGLGTWSGLASAIATGHLAGKAFSRFRSAGAKAYGAALDIPVRSETELQQVRSRGLGRAEPTAAPPGESTPATRKGVAKVESRIDRTKTDQMDRVKAATQSGTTYDLRKVLKPVYDAAAEWEDHGASPELGEKLREQTEAFLLRHPDGMGGFSVTPEELQKFKQVTDDQIKSWSRDAGDTTGGEKFRRTMRTAFDQTLDSIPGVKDLNWAMHLDYALKDAITEALSKKETSVRFIRDLTESGLLYGLGASTGHPMLAKAAAIGMAANVAREAWRDPRIMTRVGVLLDKAGIVLDPVIKQGATPGALAAAAARSSSQYRDRQKNGQAPPGAEIQVHDAKSILERWNQQQ